MTVVAMTAVDRSVLRPDFVTRVSRHDLNLIGKYRLLDALDAHQNIEIRRFNPLPTRAPSMLSKAAQFMRGGSA